MDEFIYWANANNGFLTLILTLVSALATMSAVIVSIYANKLSSRNLKQALQFEKDRNRPYVIFDIEHNKSELHAILKNNGSTAAFDVSIEINPAIKSAFGETSEDLSLTSKDISFLAPGRKISDFIGIGPKFYTLYPDPKFTGRLTYRDSEGQRYSENFSIDLNFVMGIAMLGEPEIGREIQKLTKELKDIARIAGRIEKVFPVRENND